MVRYFYGEDTYEARRAVDALARSSGARVYFVDRSDLEREGAACLVGGRGLFGATLPVVRDASVLPAALQEIVSAAVEAQPSTLFVLWDRGAPQRRSCLFQRYRGAGQQFAVPSRAALLTWLAEVAREQEIALSREALAELLEAVGPDRWRLRQEMEKLALGGEVTHGVSAASRETIFPVLEALLRGQRAAALSGMAALLAAGHGEFYILSLLAYQFRSLFVIRCGLEARRAPVTIVREGRLKSYTVTKGLPYARGRAAVFWREALARVLATEQAIRGGRVEARTGLLMLVGGLAAVLSSDLP